MDGKNGERRRLEDLRWSKTAIPRRVIEVLFCPTIFAAISRSPDQAVSHTFAQLMIRPLRVSLEAGVVPAIVGEDISTPVASHPGVSRASGNGLE